MAGSGVRTYRWQRWKERAVEGLSRLGDARRDFPRRIGSTKLSTDHHVRLLASRTVIVR